MSRHLYALLVGINTYDYSSGVSPLQGCVNDVKAIQDYLAGRVATDEMTFHPLVLTNQHATREAVIEGFRKHLCQAGAEDVAFFYYAGHGAQAAAPREFWPIEPDRMLETLVCYDSRTQGGWDIADKELAQLIAEVDAKQPHISIVLDCCHSGSGTRGEGEQEVATRHAPTDWRSRPIASFLVSPDQAAEKSTSRSLKPMSTGLNLPRGRHVVLSACRNIEEAKEYHGGDIPHGTFSYFLLESLQKATGNLTYRDLFKRTNALVRSRVTYQSPQMEATEVGDLDRPFLGGAIASAPSHFTASQDGEGNWNIDGGAIHGLVRPSGAETTLLALFPLGSSAEEIKQVTGAIAEAEVTQVWPQQSHLTITRGAENLTDVAYKAVILSLPLPRITVAMEGDETGLAIARQALNTAGPNSTPSLYISESGSPEAADFKLVAREGNFDVYRRGESTNLSKAPAAYSESSAEAVVRKLEHMSRWSSVASLASPANSRIQDAVQMQIFVGETQETAVEVSESQIRLAYRFNPTAGKWDPPFYWTKLINRSERQTLYCSLFDLTETYEVDALLEGSTTVTLRPGEEIWVWGGEKLYGRVPDAQWQQGITEVQDIFKLIACTAEFDPTLLEQGELGTPPPGETRSARQGNGTLNRLMKRVTTRKISRVPESEEVYDDWCSSQVTFTFVRPKEATAISEQASVSLGAGIMVQPHTELSATIKLTTAPQSTRAMGAQTLPPLLREMTGIEPINFTATRGADPGLSIVELSDVQNPEAVTPENPLLLTTDIPLNEDEYILPVAYDGEFFLPLGYGKTEAGQTQITLEKLTPPIAQGAVTTRSIKGSILIYFQKIATQRLGKNLSKQLGIEFDYPRLAIAEVQTGEVNYIQDLAEIKARVASAERIALYIHGIFGDTASMVPTIETAIADINGEAKPIGSLYDLVLSFDYENINTSIERNGLLLKKRLNAVGLGANHGKQLHIIAHSMGGLVSRSFIEQADGHEVVQHLIMLGTPNAGSPWPQVQAGLTAAVAFAINGLSLAFAPLKLLNIVLNRVETIDVSLDQMLPSSDFLAELASSSDPGVPYTIVAGDTSLIPNNEDTDLKQRLVKKLGKVVELPFGGQPNDIAVLVDSIANVPVGRNPEPKIIPAACNHLVYFTDLVGLTALTKAVIGTGITKERTTATTQSAQTSTDKTTALSIADDSETPKGGRTAKTNSDREINELSTTSVMVDSSDQPARKAGSKVMPWLIGLTLILIGGLLVVGLMQRSESVTPQQTSFEQIE